MADSVNMASRISVLRSIATKVGLLVKARAAATHQKANITMSPEPTR